MADDSERPTIHALDDRTVERIAAGEVVERPASAVKELVENAIDADADRVAVSVTEGGRKRLQVRDDGHGMTERAVCRAIEEHTTSKIDDAADLDALSTLGFRGEALHAIGAVSRLTIRTRPPDGRGTELRVEGGEVTAVDPVGCPAGTSVEVADLFYNVPARRRYLKRPATEFDHVQRVVSGYALAHPDVRVSLEHDGRERFRTPGQDDRRGAALAVYGREVAEAMHRVDATPAAAGLERIAGLVSDPEVTRTRPTYCSTFINGRVVTVPTVREAIVAAYRTQLGDRYPFAALALTIDPARIDVNIHPRKREVRFADPDAIADAVEAAVADTLETAGLVRSSAPRGVSAPDETAIDPGATGTRDADTAGDADDAGATGHDAATDAKADGDIAGTDGRSRSEREPGSEPGRGSGAKTQGETEMDATDAATPADDGDEPTGELASRTARGRPDVGAGARTGPAGRHADAASTGGMGSTPAADESDRDDRSEGSDGTRTAGDDGRLTATEQTRLGDGPPEPADDRLPALEVLGQLHDTYLVCASPDGLVLVDQHAADERINYERLRTRLAESPAQSLARPVEVTLTDREAALFERRGAVLERLGFRATLADGAGTGDGDGDAGVRDRDRNDGNDTTATADGHVLSIRAVPAPLVRSDRAPELARDALAALVDGAAAAADTVDEAVTDLLADLACRPSVTANTSLSEGSVRELLTALDDCENPYACPHGRPTLIAIDADELEARFERDYPGHG